jgi:hypothetical protein
MSAKARFLLFALNLFLVAVVTAVSPAEKTLGANARIVYLHGAWVWSALAGFLAAAITALAGLGLHKTALLRWSQALGWTGLAFWITYLPLSMWAMQTNWNGLFLAEPRFRLGLAFALSGLLLQVGLALLDRLSLTSAANILYALILILSLSATQNVLHPPSPILNSNAWRIQAYFAVLLLLTLPLGFQVAHWFYHRKSLSR